MRSLTTTPKLVRGGVLSFLIPLRSLLHRILRLAEISRFLASQYKFLTVLCFSDGEYERFKRILLLATRREKYNVPTNEKIEAIERLAQSDLPSLGCAPEPVCPLPASLKSAGGRAITFRRMDWFSKTWWNQALVGRAQDARLARPDALNREGKAPCWCS